MSWLSLAFPVLILALMGVSIYEHINTVTLSLPLSPVLTFLTILLPVFAAVNAFALPYLTRKSSHPPKSLLNPTHPAVIQVLQGILTTVFATLYATHIAPGESGTCELSTIWQRLFRGKDVKSIRAIQDAFECCGFRSVKDMAWPFPPADVPCTVRFDRSVSCQGPWTSALQRNAGVEFGVVIAVGLLQIVSCVLARHYGGRFQAFSWRDLFGQGSRRTGNGSSSARPLLTGRESHEEVVDEEIGGAGDENGHRYGAMDNNRGLGPRIEPSGLNEERNEWQDG
ncbi:hypothetical protein VP1G_07884 [Cytospora mali]|uniref:Tetraspanin Tsp3 n=1 Tax=Cytospora mali TaxID=578113 RepID=A0A194V9G8_CYTMA|nr:hypothetical protein VP1G_07884 [Valsa mali var. pyri (nom. inval.)]